MGREVRRVPMDFDWEIGKVWDGFLLPQRLHGATCATCRRLKYLQMKETA